MSEAERKAWEDGFRQGQLDGRRWAAEWIEAERAKGSDPEEYGMTGVAFETKDHEPEIHWVLGSEGEARWETDEAGVDRPVKVRA